MGVLTREQVFAAISAERDYQDRKWGADKELSLTGYLMVAEDELDEAKRGWIKNLPGRSSALSELVQVAAVCVAALEKYGVQGTTYNTDDIPGASGTYTDPRQLELFAQNES